MNFFFCSFCRRKERSHGRKGKYDVAQKRKHGVNLFLLLASFFSRHLSPWMGLEGSLGPVCDESCFMLAHEDNPESTDDQREKTDIGKHKTLWRYHFKGMEGPQTCNVHTFIKPSKHFLIHTTQTKRKQTKKKKASLSLKYNTNRHKQISESRRCWCFEQLKLTQIYNDRQTRKLKRSEPWQSTWCGSPPLPLHFCSRFALWSLWRPYEIHRPRDAKSK